MPINCIVHILNIYKIVLFYNRWVYLLVNLIMHLFMTKRWVRIDLLDTKTLYTERPPHFRDSFETLFIKQANSHWFKGFGGTGGYTERQIQFLSLINKTKKIINYAYGIYFLLCFITFNILLKKKTVQIRVKNAVGPKAQFLNIHVVWSVVL